MERKDPSMVSGYGVDALYVIRLGQGGFHEVSVGVRESPDGRLWQTATIRLVNEPLSL